MRKKCAREAFHENLTPQGTFYKLTHTCIDILYCIISIR